MKENGEKRKKAVLIKSMTRRQHLKTYHYDDVPSYLQDNNFIWNGYRAFYSYNDNWHSIFAIHNETGNIWTHLIGTAIMIYLMVDSWYSLHERADFYDILIFTLYFISSIKCLLFSTLCHIHTPHSEEAFCK
jgi:adiponectin receptor